jgi:hypothetical protein
MEALKRKAELKENFQVKEYELGAMKDKVQKDAEDKESHV